jgi:thiol-disulfide isomerase/thioredoxin
MIRYAMIAALALGHATSFGNDRIADEFAKINATFADSIKTVGGDRANYGKAVAERNAALTKLAESAEAEKSNEHGSLARIYLLLDRPQDAVRHAEAAVAAGADDIMAYVVLTNAQAGAGNDEAAVAAFRRLLAVELKEENASQFVVTTPTALNAVVGRLNSSDKFDAAEKLLEEWQAKVAAYRSDSESLRQSIEQSQRAIGFLRARIAGEKARAELIGKPYFPIEQPTWLNGESISPEQLHGKVVLLDFWAVWCGPCIATFPHLIEWHDKYADKGLVVIGVTRRYQFDWDAEAKHAKHVDNLEPHKEDAATLEFAKHHGLKHRLAVVPTDADLSRKYGVTGIPQVVLIDRNGVIQLIKVGSGEANAQAVEAEIRKLLGMETTSAKK